MVEVYIQCYTLNRSKRLHISTTYLYILKIQCLVSNNEIYNNTICYKLKIHGYKCLERKFQKCQTHWNNLGMKKVTHRGKRRENGSGE